MSVDLHAMLDISRNSNGAKNIRTKNDTKTERQPEKSAWGMAASGVSTATSSKSLKEIQEEEAMMRAKQQAMKSNHVNREWASRAGATSWGFKHTNNAPTPAMEDSLAGQISESQLDQGTRNASFLDLGGGVRNSTSDSTDNFGGQTMNEEMRRWCKTQVKKLGADMSLIEFCYTLVDASDIREYLRDYLGSTPQVSAFASEFIKRKQNAHSRPPIHEDSSTPNVDSAGFVTATSKKHNRKGKKTSK
jgi:hypothetical protein